MFAKVDNTTFYGIKNINEKLEEIIDSLSLCSKVFELKLIMCEAITNAFIHGNERDSSKPIYVGWKLEGNFITISVKDCGNYNKDLILKQKIDDDGIMKENGRGLFIISSYSDEVRFKDGCIVMKKILLN